MYWADEIAKKIINSGKHRPYWVDDMKTPSGFSHVGSMLGPVLHSLVYRSLKDAGRKVTFSFVINDFDTVDGLPKELTEKYSRYLGFPLKTTPSPSPDFKNMADYFADDFVKSFKALGVEAKTVSSWEMYHEGKFDELIRTALDNAEKIQDIYKKVSGSAKKEKGWLPLQVICENCGKLGTTRVFDWDGQLVKYKCEPDLVAWAAGCGSEGRVSPFGGNAKLPWKVDWAAHWKVLGITIEGAGKDHASKGGSYDVALAICKDVFKYPQPFKLPYEWILFGGRKMSTSKGVGMKAHDLVKILPPSVARFLFARHDFQKQTNFNAQGTMAIPDLFDEYDRAWESFIKRDGSDLARVFELSQINDISLREKAEFPRFRDVATYLGQPNVDIQKVFPKVNKQLLDERVEYAKIWIERYAPEEFRQQMSEDLPKEVQNLTDEQKKYLMGVIILIGKTDDPEKLQKDLYNLSKEQNIDAKSAFTAIYKALMGKDHGPKAGWMLLEYPKNKIIERLNEASK